MQPDVTFLVAAYNAADTIGGAIRSALGQTGVTVEVVVVDDASSDATAAAVSAFEDPRVRLHRLTQNRGPGGARNHGLDTAQGRYIAVLDADDVVRPDRMRRLVARLDATGGAAMVDGIEVETSDGAVVPMFSKGELAGRDVLRFGDFIRANQLFSGSHNFGYLKPVFRRAFLEDAAIRYPERLRIGEDYQFLAEVLASGGLCLVEAEIGYTYRITQGSISRILTLQHVETIAMGDAIFLADRRLDPEATAAYAERLRSTRRAHAFLTMVEGLKRREPRTVLAAALRDPTALLHFRMPIAKRWALWRDGMRKPKPSFRPDPVRGPANGE